MTKHVQVSVSSSSSEDVPQRSEMFISPEEAIDYLDSPSSSDCITEYDGTDCDMEADVSRT